jgi:hypothetical protein
MKLIIAGSRTISPSSDLIFDLLNHFRLSITEVVSGTAGGVDKAGELFVREIDEAQGVQYALTKFPADWNTHGKAAGHIRNKQMADYADALLLIWDGESKGSANMKMNMEKLKKPVFEIIIKGNL